jgi:hypothetical protein
MILDDIKVLEAALGNWDKAQQKINQMRGEPPHRMPDAMQEYLDLLKSARKEWEDCLYPNRVARLIACVKDMREALENVYDGWEDGGDVLGPMRNARRVLIQYFGEGK